MSNPLRRARRPFRCTELNPSPAEALAGEAGGLPPADSPRVLTGGESHGHNAFVDWLSFTVAEECFSNPLAWALALSEYLQVPGLTAGPRERGIAGFRYSAPLLLETHGEPVGVGKIAWGGESQNGRVYVSLSGTLCARVIDWEPVKLVLDLIDARITRIDLAHDDVEGRHSVDQAVDWYEAGGFDAGGRSPNCRTDGDWLNSANKGRTFYVGNRKHGKLLRVYEKGKQLGDASSPWVRWEVEFHNRDRWLPYEMLTKPSAFLAGSYSALGFVSWDKIAVRTQRKAVKASLQHLVEHLAKSYGKTINALRLQGFDADDILAQVLRPGLPERLKHALAACPPGTAVYGSQDGEP